MQNGPCPLTIRDVYRFFVPAFSLTFLIAFFTGAVIDAWMFHPAPLPVVMTDDTPPAIPVVSINGIRNGALVGSVSGTVRLTARNRIVPIDGSGAFAITDRAVLTNNILITVPAGMMFVASKRGKKYYPVTSASAAGLAPANRIYFPDAKSAEKAGYRR